MHRLDASSPLFGLTPETLVAQEAEIHLALTGTDETTLQPVHGRFMWESPAFAWGARMADIVSTDAEGNITLDTSAVRDLPHAAACSSRTPHRRRAARAIALRTRAALVPSKTLEELLLFVANGPQQDAHRCGCSPLSQSCCSSRTAQRAQGSSQRTSAVRVISPMRPLS